MKENDMALTAEMIEQKYPPSVGRKEGDPAFYPERQDKMLKDILLVMTEILVQLKRRREVGGATEADVQ